MIHELKCLTSYFLRLKDGSKKFEIRENDRNFKIGDQLILKEFIPKDYWDPEEPKEDEYTGEILHREITYVLSGDVPGLLNGYAILGLSKI